MNKIYVKNFKRTRTTKIEDIFKRLITISYKIGNSTYYDKECTQLQCEAHRSRSLTDIVKIVQTYFPNSNYKNIFKRLYNYIDHINNERIGKSINERHLFIYCPDINQIVLQVNWFTDEKDKISYNYYPYHDVYIRKIYNVTGRGQFSFKDLITSAINLSDTDILANSFYED